MRIASHAASNLKIRGTQAPWLTQVMIQYILSKPAKASKQVAGFGKVSWHTKRWWHR
jgi:hypothetical protein